jgi:alkanesulfonate monooxygenase SsuD/methylene tetrahydromethanopterin reductase-like flavin-dependent oxidoreductase (luciferase family)
MAARVLRTCRYTCIHLEKIWRNPKSIQRSWLGISVVGKNETQVKERCRSITSLSQEQFSREIAGTPDVCAEKIGEYVDLGVSEFILIPENQELETLTEFSREVMNRF